MPAGNSMTDSDARHVAADYTARGSCNKDVLEFLFLPTPQTGLQCGLTGKLPASCMVWQRCFNCTLLRHVCAVSLTSFTRAMAACLPHGQVRPM
jgi:hypothetical protein